MKLAVKSAAILLFALLVAAPTSALAAKKTNDGFRINVRVSLYCPPDDLCYYVGRFNAHGTIVDAGIIDSSGKMSYASDNWFRLDDGQASGVVVFAIVRESTFEVWATDEDYVQTLLATGTAEGKTWRDGVSWGLEGTLIGG
jgi:hypothetical protein